MALSSLLPKYVIDSYEAIRVMKKRKVLLEVLNLATMFLSVYMLWKGLGVVFNNSSPFAVVLSESMSPGFERGDVLFVNNNFSPRKPVAAGDIVLFTIKGRDIPIVHRVLKLHEERGAPHKVKILTKGDNNDVHDRGLYKRGQKWLSPEDLVGRVSGYGPFFGQVTIIMNDFPPLKFLAIALMFIMSRGE